MLSWSKHEGSAVPLETNQLSTTDPLTPARNAPWLTVRPGVWNSHAGMARLLSVDRRRGCDAAWAFVRLGFAQRRCHPWPGSRILQAARRTGLPELHGGSGHIPVWCFSPTLGQSISAWWSVRYRRSGRCGCSRGFTGRSASPNPLEGRLRVLRRYVFTLAGFACWPGRDGGFPLVENTHQGVIAGAIMLLLISATSVAWMLLVNVAEEKFAARK